MKLVSRLARQGGKSSGLPRDADILLAGPIVRRLLSRARTIERTLLIPVEPLATHAQDGFLTVGHDWDVEASSVETWRKALVQMTSNAPIGALKETPSKP